MNPIHISPLSTAREECRAMTLVIAMAFMSFVVLLMLSFITLVRVEVELSTTQAQRLEAESNALLGLHVALGELQQALGPDRRVSATADILTEAQPHKGRTEPVAVKQSHWTGVWNMEGGLSQWLVSGNESTTEATHLYQDSNIAYEPDAELVGVNAGLEASDPVTVEGQEALVLVASGSVGVDDVGAMVLAPAVSVNGSGAYAWWVGDEGVKARLDCVDQYETDGESSAVARHLSAQRNAIELMSGFDSYANLGVDVLGKLSSTDQFRVSLPALTEAEAQAHFHDLTLWSKGLLVDVRNGGLRRDLTYLFELNEDDFLDELPDLYLDADVVLQQDDEGTTPIAQMGVTTPDWYFDANPKLDAANFQPWTLMNLPFGPTWEQLRSFYRLKDEVVANTVPIRPQREDQAGIYPILLQARVFTGISRVMTGAGADLLPHTDDDEMEVFAHFRIMFLLANPYTVDLDVSDMHITFYMRGGELPVSFTGEVFGLWTELFNHQRFHIASGTIPAGEARIYTLDRIGADTSANASYPFYTISSSGFSSHSHQPALVTHELTNDYDELVSLRCQLPGGPYSRLETDGAYLEAGSPGGSDGVVLTWSGNPMNYRDVLQFSGSIGSGNMDGSFYGGNRFSDYIDATTADGQVAWGGGSRWMMTDVSKAQNFIGNHIREVTIRAPYRNPNSDPYSPLGTGQFVGGQRFPSITAGVTRSKKFGAEELLYVDDSSASIQRAGWGMLYAPYDGQNPYFLNRWFYTPSSEMPVNSLGQLQHFNASGYIPTEPASKVYNMDYSHARYYYNEVYNLTTSGLGYDDFPTLAFNAEYAIGNSFSSRYVERDRVYQGDSVLFPRDASWLLNAALWDRFYFSSMPQSGAFDLSSEKLLNNRYQALVERGRTKCGSSAGGLD
ncbi:hypothetical protein SH580_19275 [Coraliomargarita algicola]|uniref:Uncharacterized protein n=1 Tax=Coraliomargarita algicola TaxID=3092156 RepID=A0ABZ0RKF3_9BACT|nr:hypothetical protein [Coraliomargarita sp. J2-16]WPJ95563.1 hypothetical protein SH580_19275 [Coraliomargarita sp. J2-16]